jgi:hypothetical protein
MKQIRRPRDPRGAGDGLKGEGGRWPEDGGGVAGGRGGGGGNASEERASVGDTGSGVKRGTLIW